MKSLPGASQIRGQLSFEQLCINFCHYMGPTAQQPPGHSRPMDLLSLSVTCWSTEKQQHMEKYLYVAWNILSAIRATVVPQTAIWFLNTNGIWYWNGYIARHVQFRWNALPFRYHYHYPLHQSKATLVHIFDLKTWTSIYMTLPLADKGLRLDVMWQIIPPSCLQRQVHKRECPTKC